MVRIGYKEIVEWVVYKITSPTNKIYIGKTYDHKSRMNDYKNKNCKNQIKLYYSLLKYGFENHKVEIVDRFTSNDSYANEREVFWISSYRSNFSKFPEQNGLNLTDGGEGRRGAVVSEATRNKLREYNRLHPPQGMKGKKMSQETKDKIRATKSKRYYPPKPPKPTKEETRLKMSMAKKGKAPPNKGKPMPPHQIELLRKINTGRPSWNKGKKYDHLSPEERKIKFGSHNIGHTFNRGRKQNPEVIAARAARQIGVPNVALYKPIIRFNKRGEMVMIYKSIKEAAERSVFSEWTIRSIASGQAKRTNTFMFKYKAA